MTHPADQSNPAGIIGMFGRVASDFASFRAKRARVRKVEQELYSFSDRELVDIGISRADIPQIAKSVK